MLWDLVAHYPKLLHEFLGLDCASYKVLEKILSVRSDNMSAEIMEAIRRAEKRETSECNKIDEFFL